MHSPSAGTTVAPRALDLCIAGTNVRIEGPEAVLAVLEATLSFVPRFSSTAGVDIAVCVRPRDDAWEIQSDGGSLKILAAQSALPQVAGAVVSSIVSDVAARRNCVTVRASVIEKDGRALALIGDDWDSAITLAAHLHGRGWSYVGTDNVLLDPETLDVFPIQKSLYVNSSAIAQFPMEYRRAVEASPWYVTAQGISFYAVDPQSAGHRHTWSLSAHLRGVVVVDGTILDQPSLESIEPRMLQEERFSRLGVDWKSVPIIDLKLGGFHDTADLIEHWFESIRA